MSEPTDDGIPRDDWLRAALRHAPDAQAAPPPAVSEAILRAARDEVGTARTAPRPPAPVQPPVMQALHDAWLWLTRPPVAAGFASLMIATVVGVMWWDGPRDDRDTASPGAPEDAARVAQAPAAPAAPEPPAPAAAPAPAAKALPRPAPTAPAREQDTRRRAEVQRDQGLREREAGTLAKVQESEARARASSERAEASTAAAAAAAAARTPPVAPSVVAGAAPGAVADEAPAANVAAPPSAAAPAPMAQALARRDAPAPLGALRTVIATEPERWAWQRDAGAAVAMNTPVMQWLQRVGETARGRWAVPDGPPAVGAAPAVTLSLLRDGQLHTTLRLGPAGIEVEGRSPRLRAELPAAEATALRVELDQATR